MKIIIVVPNCFLSIIPEKHSSDLTEMSF